MFTYVNKYIYIYYLIGSPTSQIHICICIYIYIYLFLSLFTLNPTTIPLSHHSSNSRLLLLLLAAAGCCYTFEEMGEMQASANVPIRDIYQVYHLNRIYKIGGKNSHHIFELYTRFIIFRLVVKYIHHIFEIYTRFIICRNINVTIIGGKIYSSYT